MAVKKIPDNFEKVKFFSVFSFKSCLVSSQIDREKEFACCRQIWPPKQKMMRIMRGKWNTSREFALHMQKLSSPKTVDVQKYLNSFTIVDLKF